MHATEVLSRAPRPQLATRVAAIAASTKWRGGGKRRASVSFSASVRFGWATATCLAVAATAWRRPLPLPCTAPQTGHAMLVLCAMEGGYPAQ